MSIPFLFQGLNVLVPGMTILYVRSQFVTARPQLYSTRTIPLYLTVSVIYWAPILSLVNFFPSLKEFINNESGFFIWILWLVVTFIIPAIVGLLLGLNIQKEWLRKRLRFSRWFHLNPVHGIATAWDWKFNDMNPYQKICITLKDGRCFSGMFGFNSFISSNPTERDIYVQWIQDNDNEDSSNSEAGIYIAAGEVCTIEFLPYNSKQN